MITGESSPVQREVGTGWSRAPWPPTTSLRVRITAIGDDTAPRRHPATGRGRTCLLHPRQLLADRAAGWLFWYALGSALVAATVWTFVGRRRTRWFGPSRCS
jgi:Cu2+-exporting ATPase